MAGFMDKLPNLNEVTTMAKKLFKDIKKSVSEIAVDYQAKRAESESQSTTASSAHPDEDVAQKVQEAEIEKQKLDIEEETKSRVSKKNDAS